jgi:hypothetical protein
MTYMLLRCQRKQSHDQWTECPSTGINDLHAVEVPEKANHDQWTECPSTGINDLLAVEVPEKAKS